jgi:hypothetical protein
VEGSPIPESHSPIFTTAMRGLIVTTTNFTGQEKVIIPQRILDFSSRDYRFALNIAKNVALEFVTRGNIVFLFISIF